MVDPMRSIRISDDLWKQAKKGAVDQDMTLQDWVALAIIRLLDDNRRLSQEFANLNKDDHLSVVVRDEVER